MTEKDLMTTLQACNLIGCTRPTVENYRRRGWLHAIRLANGRILFTRQNVERLREMLAKRKGLILVQASQAPDKKEKPPYQSLKNDFDQTLFKPEVWEAVRQYQEARKAR
jgi:DNA-binding transcriptional MerR regulator